MATDIVIRDQSRRIVVQQDGRSIVVPVAPRRISVVHGAIINLQTTGVSDHGALAGLGDDDHPQYLTEGRGDARYDALGAATAAAVAAVGAHVAAADPHPGYLTPAEANAAYEPIGQAAAAVAAHAALTDPHPTYLTAPEGLAAGILSDIPAKLRDKKFLALDLINGVAATGDDAGNASLSTVEALASTLTVPAGAQSYDRKRKIVSGLANKLRYHHAFDGQPLGVLFEPAHSYLNAKTQPLVSETSSIGSLTDTTGPSAAWPGNWIAFGDNSTRRFTLRSQAVVTGTTYWLSALVQMTDGAVPATVGNYALSGWDFIPYIAGGHPPLNPDTGTAGMRVTGPFADNVYLIEAYAVSIITAASSFGIDKQTTNSPKTFKVGPVCFGSGRYPPSLFDNATSTPNTRAADRLDVPLSGFVGDQLTVFGAFVAPPADTAYKFVFSVNGATISDRIEGYFSSSGSMAFLVNVVTGGVLQCTASLGTLVSGQAYQFFFAVDGVAKRIRGKCTGIAAIDTPIASYSPPPIQVAQICHQGGSYQLRSGAARFGVIDRAWSAAEGAEWVDGFAAKTHTHAQADITNLPADLAAKAPLASPTFTGTPAAPTAAPGTNTTQIATAAFVQAAIAALVASSPAALDTLKELADALGSDPNFATTVTNALAGKAPLVHTHAGLAPAGGASGQVLKKNSATDHDYSWQADAAGAGSQEVYIQQTRPVAAGPWVWWETDGLGSIINLTINDGL